MARIVAAMAMTHSPGLTGWFTRAPEAYQQLALGATAEMRRRLEAARPDALVMFTNDHLLNWPINNIPEYAVGIGEEHVGPADWFDEWLGMEKYRVPGHPALARWIVNEGARRRLQFAWLRRMQFDDGISVPTHYLNPDARFRLVPVGMNCTVPPIPTPERAYHVGSVLRDVLHAYPGDDRIAVIATGGLSHEPGGPRYFWVDEEFDRWFLDLLAKGDHETLLAECTLERMEAAGSGGTAELLSWFLVLAMTRGPADVLAYMPAVAWRSGPGTVARPGDVLVVEIVEVRPRASFGWTAIRPGRGLLPEAEFAKPFLQIWDLADGTHARMGHGIAVPIEPFPGVMGTALDEPGRHSTMPPRKNGGNMDVKHLVAGTTLYLPVWVDGALFSVGDAHAAQGDGEVCVTAVEMVARVTLRFDLQPRRALKEPQLRTRGPLSAGTNHGPFFATTAHGPDLFAAAQQAVRYMIDHLVTERGLSREEAYILSSVAGDLKISEIAHTPNWIVSAFLP